MSSSILIQYLYRLSPFILSVLLTVMQTKIQSLNCLLIEQKKNTVKKKKGSKESNLLMNTCADNKFFLVPPQFKVVYLINGKFYRNSFSKWSKFVETKYWNNTEIFFCKKVNKHKHSLQLKKFKLINLDRKWKNF